MLPHIYSPSEKLLTDHNKKALELLPQLSVKKPPLIKLNKQLNFFVDFERFKRLTMPSKAKKKKQKFLPVNIHTAKLKISKPSFEMSKSPDSSFIRKTSKYSQLGQTLKSKSIKFIDLKLGEILERRKSHY